MRINSDGFELGTEDRRSVGLLHDGAFFAISEANDLRLMAISARKDAIARGEMSNIERLTRIATCATHVAIVQLDYEVRS